MTFDTVVDHVFIHNFKYLIYIYANPAVPRKQRTEDIKKEVYNNGKKR